MIAIALLLAIISAQVVMVTTGHLYIRELEREVAARGAARRRRAAEYRNTAPFLV